MQRLEVSCALRRMSLVAKWLNIPHLLVRKTRYKISQCLSNRCIADYIEGFFKGEMLKSGRFTVDYIL